MLAASYAELGQADKAAEAVDELRRIDPNISITKLRKLLPYKNKNDLERELVDLRNAGVPKNGT